MDPDDSSGRWNLGSQRGCTKDTHDRNGTHDQAMKAQILGSHLLLIWRFWLGRPRDESTSSESEFTTKTAASRANVISSRESPQLTCRILAMTKVEQRSPKRVGQIEVDFDVSRR